MCIMKNDTGIDINTPIYFRKNYIEGAGQLCDKCFEEVYCQNKC